MFRSELTGETSGPHPRPDLAIERTGGSTGAESLHSRNMFILTEVDWEMQHHVSFLVERALRLFQAARACITGGAGNFARSRLLRRLFRGVAALPARGEPAQKPAAARIGCPTICAERRPD